MTSTARIVWNEIEEDAIIRSALEKGIVSLKNLAVHLIKKRDLNTGVDAVISAIRRYKEESPLERKFETARKLIAQSEDIRITSNIVNIALEKNKEIQDLVQKAFSIIDYDKGEILLIIQGEQSIKLLINKKNKEKVLAIFPKKAIVSIDEQIAGINIHLARGAVTTPGVSSVLTTELMMHDINIIETMSCLPEMLFFMKQKDVVTAYTVLFNLCNIQN